MAPATLIWTLCVALVLVMMGFMPVAAVLPGIFADWGITEAQAGWLNGVYFGGYALGVPVLLPLTDRLELSAGLTYYLSRYAAIKAEFRREELRSSVPDSDYKANIVMLGLRLQR
jgi:MFS family permease